MTTQPIASGMIITAPQRVTPSSGDTVNIQNIDGDVFLILAPATDIAALTLNWPAIPYNVSQVTIMSTANIASITHTGNTLNLPFNAMKASGSVVYVYDQAGAIYMCSEINSTSQLNMLPFATTVTSAGNALVYPTSDGTATGTALFSSITGVNAFPTIANPNIACGKATIAGNLKTITIPCATQTFTGVTVLGISVLGTNTVAATANGVAITCLIQGVLAT